MERAIVSQSKQSKAKIAEQLYDLYQETIRSLTPRKRVENQPLRLTCKGCYDAFFGSSYSTKFCRKCRPSKLKDFKFSELDKAARVPFMAAARICILAEATPREFIVAQFAAWRAASAFHQKMLWPNPGQLGSFAAHVRYLQHKAREAVRVTRVSVIEEQDEERRWFVEERKLKGFSRTFRRDPVEVMTERPEEFSREFLEHKGVWDVVADLWDERNGRRRS